MWRKQDEPQAPSSPAQTTPESVATAPRNPATNQPVSVSAPLSGPPAGHLTRLLVVKGEINGKEDLFVDGEVHGKIRLEAGKLTIGPDGRVMADVDAREVVVRGEVRGKIQGHDRVQIAATGRVYGEIITRLISIEEGAEVHVKVNPERDERRPSNASFDPEAKPVSRPQASLNAEAARVNA